MLRHAFLFLCALGCAQAQPAVNSIITAGAFGGFVGVAAPGSYVEIYGANLAGTSCGWATTDFNGPAAPTTLDGVTVTVNGTPGFVSYISPGQINAQLPDNIPTGGSVPVVVTYQGQSSAATPLTINPIQPGLLRLSGTPYAAAFRGATLVTGAASPGETLTLYGTGFGPVRPGQVAGRIANGQTALANPLTVSIGGLNATVPYAGLAPGLVGVYQFNIVVPIGLPTGDQAIKLSLNGADATLQNLQLAVRANTNTGFTLSSSAVQNGALPPDYTCDGTGSTLPLSWSGAPAATKEFAVMMTTLPGDGSTKWNWVLYRIPATTSNLPKDAFLAGSMGVGSDGPGTVYNPPCSQGPGAKIYTFTIYALSDSPNFSVPATQVNGQMVTDAISSLTLASAKLDTSYARPSNAPGSAMPCGQIVSSVHSSRSGTATVGCDDTYAYISSLGMTTHQTMNGITSTNLQIPIPQNFQGANGWKIPLRPAIAAAPTSVVDGPLGVAVNGVPIFNPCTQGGCVTGGDTKVLGQLDTCNGHAGRADDYHYHAAPVCMMADQPANYWDTHPLGWALDGFAIYGYRDSDGSTAFRDTICGGNTKPAPNGPSGYAYHVTDASPYITNCLIGTPSPDLPNQGSKYRPFRQPPVTPFVVSNMTLTTDASDGYQVLQFTSAINFRTTETGQDSYSNAPGTYRIRYKQVTGADLAALLALRQNANASACWNFQFANAAGATTQPAISYCK